MYQALSDEGSMDFTLSSSSKKKPSRLRKSNWTREEINALIKEVEAAKYLGYGKEYSNTKITPQERFRAWAMVTQSVNLVGPCKRTINEVRKKWQDVKYNGKKKEAMINANGHGKTVSEYAHARIHEKLEPTVQQQNNSNQNQSNSQQQQQQQQGGLNSSHHDNRDDMGYMGNMGLYLGLECVQAFQDNNQAPQNPNPNNPGPTNTANDKPNDTEGQSVGQPRPMNLNLENLDAQDCYKLINTKGSTIRKPTASEQLLELEREKIKLKRDKLKVMREMLRVQKDRLAFEKEKEKQKGYVDQPYMTDQVPAVPPQQTTDHVTVPPHAPQQHPQQHGPPHGGQHPQQHVPHGHHGHHDGSGIHH